MKPQFKARLITLRQRIKEVPFRIAAQMSGRLDDATWNGETPRQVIERVKSLNLEKVGHRRITKITGSSWTATTCDICKKHGEFDIIQLGDEPDYESSTVNVCLLCIEKIHGMIQITR